MAPSLNVAGIYAPDFSERKLPRPSEVRRVEQRTNRDCLRCSVAMVTGLTYEEVPDFVSTSPSWSGALRNWLQNLGLTFVRAGVDIDDVPLNTCSIEIGRTAAGGFHAIAVASERLDPDPLRRGFVEPAKHRLVILPLARFPA